MVAVAALAAAACSGDAGARPRYEMARDQGSRHDFRYARERASKLWVLLHCELRVPIARELPDPLRTEETGDLISYTRHNPGSMGSAGIAPAGFVERDGYRVWLYREVAREADLEGSASLTVQARWPVEGTAEPRMEAMESFTLPALETMRPYEWTPWRRADELRDGFFAGWEKVHGKDAEALPPPEHPYELRCRPVLTDHLYIPVESEDPNIARPDPSGGMQR